MTTDTRRARGRPRLFDPEQAVETAQYLFHAHGYDGVSVSDLTKALGINPPSFYAAFGSKAGLYARVVRRYGAAGAIPLDKLLRPDRPVAESLAALMEAAARNYAADPSAAGCFVLEGLRCSDPEARAAARAENLAADNTIRRYIGARHPEKADSLTDFVSTSMAGLSDRARNGHNLDRLLATARLVGTVLAQTLQD
jgi:TetR/AcrR family transcriptional repressor for divergent bdcA